MTQVICLHPMTYNSVQRYKGEIFSLIGARNDDALVRVGHVRVIDGNSSVKPVHDDYSGRDFTDESALRTYRETAPQQAIVVRRGPGRPRREAASK